MFMLPIKKWGKRFTSEGYREVAGFNGFAVELLDYPLIIVDSILNEKTVLYEKSRFETLHQVALLVQIQSAEQFGFEFGKEAVIDIYEAR